MASPERGQPADGVRENISQELATIHEESYGVRPKAVETYLLDDAVISVMEIDLLQHERLLLNHGKHDSVQEVRTAYQKAIEATFSATVEHTTGRRVVGFISDTHLDPPFTIEFFKLAPAEVPAEEPEEPRAG